MIPIFNKKKFSWKTGDRDARIWKDLDMDSIKTAYCNRGKPNEYLATRMRAVSM